MLRFATNLTGFLNKLSAHVCFLIDFVLCHKQ